MIKTLLSALTILVILIVLVSVSSRPMTLGAPFGRAMATGWWCWSGGALLDPHPSPYGKGMDHPCTQDEYDTFKLD